jgi:hypothetical protein
MPDIKKKYFDIKAEIMVPATIIYRVLAENEQDALRQIDKATTKSFKPLLHL